MRRRLIIGILVLLLVSGLAAAGLVAYRAAIAQRVAERLLADLGFPEAWLTIEEIGWSRARISALHAGQGDELALAELVVLYRMPVVLNGTVEELRLKGLALKLDLTGEQALLGSLDAPVAGLLDAAGKDAAPRRAPPRLLVEDGRIDALTALGPVAIDFEGQVAPDQAGAIATSVTLALSTGQGRLLGRLRAAVTAEGSVSGGLRIDRGSLSLGADSFAAEVLAGGIEFAWRDDALERLEGELAFDDLRLAGAGFGAAELRVGLAGTELSAEGRLGTGADSYDLAFRAALSGYPHAPWIDAALTLDSDAAAPIWRLLPEPRPAAGHMGLALRARGGLAPAPPPDSGPEALLAWLSGGDLTAELELGLDAVALPGLADAVDATVLAAATLEERVLEVSLTRDAGATLAGVAPEALAAAGVPPAWLDGGLAVTLAAGGEIPFAGRLSARGPDTRLELSGAASLTAAEHAALTLAGGADIDLDAAHRLIRARFENVVLTASSPALPDTPVTALTIKGSLSGAIAGSSPAAKASDAPGPDHALALEAVDLGFKVRRADTTPLTLKGRLARVAFEGTRGPDGAYGGEATLDGGRLTLPELTLGLDALSIRAPFGAAGGGASGDGAAGIGFTVPALRDLAKPIRFHPVKVTGNLRPRGETLELAATVSGPERNGRVNITARQSLDEGRGTLRAVLVPLEFRPGGTQPQIFSPALEAMQKVAGQVEAKVDLSWDRKRVRGNAAIGVSGLAFEAEGVKVRGLDGILVLDQLTPPSSPPGQMLTVDSIDPGLPLEDVSVRFHVPPGERLRARVEQAEFSAAGGRYRLGETLIDPSQPRQVLELEIIELELAEFFEAIGIEGLSGNGRMAGTVPLRIEPDGVVIPRAELAAQAPGILRYQSETASQALASGGESVTLMLRALEDFHFEELGVALTKQADGESRLEIGMLGQNPDVLDGHPFRFNINLTGNLDPLLTAITQGRDLSSNILERTWRLRP